MAQSRCEMAYTLRLGSPKPRFVFRKSRGCFSQAFPFPAGLFLAPSPLYESHSIFHYHLSYDPILPRIGFHEFQKFSLLSSTQGSWHRAGRYGAGASSYRQQEVDSQSH